MYDRVRCGFEKNKRRPFRKPDYALGSPSRKKPAIQSPFPADFVRPSQPTQKPLQTGRRQAVRADGRGHLDYPVPGWARLLCRDGALQQVRIAVYRVYVQRVCLIFFGSLRKKLKLDFWRGNGRGVGGKGQG